MNADAELARRRCNPWPNTVLRVAFGLIWLVDAVLKWLPGFRRDYMDTIMGQAAGQPGWLKPWFRFWLDVQHPHAIFFAYLVAVIETLIALALIAGFARKLTYSAAIVFSLLIWSTAEGFGGPYTSGASDIGTAIIYAVVFAALLLFSYYQGPPRHSLDYHLERRISWWHRIAEVEPHRRTARSRDWSRAIRSRCRLYSRSISRRCGRGPNEAPQEHLPIHWEVASRPVDQTRKRWPEPTRRPPNERRATRARRTRHCDRLGGTAHSSRPGGDENRLVIPSDVR